MSIMSVCKRNLDRLLRSTTVPPTDRSVGPPPTPLSSSQPPATARRSIAPVQVEDALQDVQSGYSRGSARLRCSCSRVIIVWLSWLVGGVCGVAILLVIICYCRLMPRHQKSYASDEKYIKENHKEVQTSQESSRVKHAQAHRYVRPVSYAGPVHHSHKSTNLRGHEVPSCHAASQARDQLSGHCYVNNIPNIKELSAQYSSSGMLDEMDSAANMDALKTRSLPAFLRPKPRPLSTEDDLQQLYAKVNYSKKYKNRMRNEHAAVIALSKSHSQFLDSDAVIVYDQRTAL